MCACSVIPLFLVVVLHTVIQNCDIVRYFFSNAVINR